MVNLDNQRPGDVWMAGGERFEVVEVRRCESSGWATEMVCERPGGALITVRVEFKP